jgi:hypothetical protein
MFEEARKNAFVSKGDFIHLYYFEHFVQGEKFFQIIKKPMRLKHFHVMNVKRK